MDDEREEKIGKGARLKCGLKALSSLVQKDLHIFFNLYIPYLTFP